MQQAHVTQLIWALVVGLVAGVGQANAVTKCAAKVDAKTGVINVSAKGVVGTLTWGDGALVSARTFSNAATCIADGKAKKCQLGATGTARAVTPPELCSIRLQDSAAPCVARLKGCIPGERGLYVKDSSGALFGRCREGFSGSCEYVTPDGSRVLIGNPTSPAQFLFTSTVPFAGPNCTGQAYAYTGAPGGLSYGSVIGGQLYYAPALPPALTNFQSYYSSSGMCANDAYSDVAVPALSIDVSSFVGPFTLDTLP